VDDPDNADRCVMSNYIATRWYRAPEVLLNRKRYTKAVDMWSVGCILAELLGRKPLFPGRDSFHQITLIISILGSPAPEQTEGSGKKSRDFVSSLPHKPKIPFARIFPKASPLACDLLSRLLVFDPEQRYTVEQALRHPYLEELHCEDDEPVCDTFDFQDFYFEYLKTTKDDLRSLIYQEIVNNYKEETYESATSAMDNLTAAVCLIPHYLSLYSLLRYLILSMI
jgi:mitogen-activated protein kinase 1/3